MQVKRLSHKEFVNIYSKVPKLSVDVNIITDKGIILTKRTIEPANGKWHVPGAVLLKGEDLRTGAKRIAKEELGIEVVIDKMLGVIEYQFKNYPRQDIAIAFLAHPKNKNFTIKIDNHANNAGIFKKLPSNMIKKQVDFIKEHKLLK